MQKKKKKSEKRHQQHTSFLFAVVRCVLYIVTTRVGLPISRTVINVTNEINTQQAKLKGNRLKLLKKKKKNN